MEENPKQTEKKILITKNKKRRARSDAEKHQLRLANERVKAYRKRQGITSISARMVYRIPEPCLQINRYETPIIIKFD